MFELLPYLLVIFSSLAGLALTLYIRHKKTTHESMVCPLNGHCESVINSEYSKFLGIPVELLGMAYYLALIISYSIFIIVPSLASPLIVFAVLAASTGAVCFSGYLTFIQIFTLKQLCTWCLSSAALCVLIFFAAILGSETGFISVLDQHMEILVVLQMTGVALGVGGTTMSSIFFIKFLKDFRISRWEADIMKTIDQIVWLALSVLVISWFSIYLTNALVLNQTPEFLLQSIILTIIIINGAVLTLLVSPRLVNISLGEEHEHTEGELRKNRRLSLVLISISLASWYSLLIIITLGILPIDFVPLFIIYLVTTIAVIIAGQIIERLMISENRP